jgi:hypothetical protein
MTQQHQQQQEDFWEKPPKRFHSVFVHMLLAGCNKVLNFQLNNTKLYLEKKNKQIVVHF